MISLNEADKLLKQTYLDVVNEALGHDAYSSMPDERSISKNAIRRRWTEKFVAVRTEPKIGRNEQCPCNSGKKYKYCCGGTK